MKKDRRLVLDLETKKTFDELEGRSKIGDLGVSVVGVYDYSTDEYRCYLEHEFGELQNLLIDSSLIVGFNHIGFDMPVLQPYLSIDVNTLPCFDIMLDLQGHLGHRIGLDAVAKATLGLGKTASGLDAIKYYREDRWDELKEYCLNDVKVTKDVLDYGIKNKKISYSSKFGNQIKEVKVNWSEYTGRACTKKMEENPTTGGQYSLF
jgi:hypothetical protein